MKENCKNCEKMVESIKIVVFKRDIESTPWHRNQSTQHYINVYLFQCECGKAWVSVYFQGSYPEALKEVKIAEA